MLSKGHSKAVSVSSLAKDPEGARAAGLERPPDRHVSFKEQFVKLLEIRGLEYQFTRLKDVAAFAVRNLKQTVGNQHK